MKNDAYFRSLDQFMAGSISRPQLAEQFKGQGYADKVADDMAKDVEQEAQADLPRHGK